MPTWQHMLKLAGVTLLVMGALNRVQAASPQAKALIRG